MHRVGKNAYFRLNTNNIILVQTVKYQINVIIRSL